MIEPTVVEVLGLAVAAVSLTMYAFWVMLSIAPPNADFGLLGGER